MYLIDDHSRSPSRRIWRCVCVTRLNAWTKAFASEREQRPASYSLSSSSNSDCGTLRVYQFFNSASQSMAGTPFGSMSGIAAEGIETIAKDVLPVAAGATGLQVIAHAGCATVGGQAAGQMNPLPPGIQF
jgi:hypothetical protein